MGAILPPRSRTWGLTAIMAPLFTVFGTAQWLYWMNTGDLISGPDTIAFVEMMRAYLFVDLLFAALVDIRQIPLLTGWIHHIAYYYVATRLLETHDDGFIRPFMIAELPTAILAWGYVAPSLRNERFFGSTFLLTRILLPVVSLPMMRFTDFVWNVICIALTVHIYWFGRWIARQQRQ